MTVCMSQICIRLTVMRSRKRPMDIFPAIVAVQ
jgi:hypothetical protein